MFGRASNSECLWRAKYLHFFCQIGSLQHKYTSKLEKSKILWLEKKTNKKKRQFKCTTNYTICKLLQPGSHHGGSLCSEQCLTVNLERGKITTIISGMFSHPNRQANRNPSEQIHMTYYCTKSFNPLFYYHFILINSGGEHFGNRKLDHSKKAKCDKSNQHHSQ